MIPYRSPAALSLLSVLLLAGSVPGRAAAAVQEPPSGLSADDLARVAAAMETLELSLEAEDASALGSLWSTRGFLSDWRGRRGPGPEAVEAAYREAFRAYRRTSSFELADGREVPLQRSPPVRTDHVLVTETMRPLGDTAAVLDGTWWNRDPIAPTGAPLSPEGARRGAGPPYHGAFRLVLDLGGDAARVRVLHLDPYHASRPSDDASEAGSFHFGATWENWAWGYRTSACSIQPDGTVTTWHGVGVRSEERSGRAEAGELASDTVGRTSSDSVRRYVRLLGGGIGGEPGPRTDGGSRDWGVVGFWALRVPSDGGPPERWDLGEAGDNYRVHTSPRARAIARWIHRVLRATPCKTRSPIPPDPSGR